MAKAYIVVMYRKIKDQEKFAAYAKAAGPAIATAGGKFLVRGNAIEAYESGLKERTVVIEFDNLAQALAEYHSPGYQAALRLLGDGAERDIRVCEGV